MTNRSALWDGEELHVLDGDEILVHLTEGSREQPLVIFVPGGGHLGRIAYGRGREQDFLAYWAARAGHSFLAVSYPCDHPVFSKPSAHLTLHRWAEMIAEVSAHVVDRIGLPRRIVVIGWSMGGRVASKLCSSALRHNIELEAFISFAATPPFAGLAPLTPESRSFTSEGLWNVAGPPGKRSSPYVTSWLKALALQSGRCGRCLIPEEDYLEHYVANTPIQLRGEADRIHDGVHTISLDDADTDTGGLRFGDYPICGAVIPAWKEDGRHALTDRALWGLASVQRLRHDVMAGSQAALSTLDDQAWTRLLSLVDEVPARLTRRIASSHMFFVGEDGAREAVEHLSSILAAVRALRTQFATLIGP
ncbi:hypothetical protein ACWEKM_35880 [Streptomyces sp. NPDC004752]